MSTSKKYALITGSLALTSSIIISFFKSLGSLSEDGKSFISLINTIIALSSTELRLRRL